MPIISVYVDRQTYDRQIKQIDRQTDRLSRQLDRQTDRQIDRQAGRQIDRQKDRQIRQIDIKVSGQVSRLVDRYIDLYAHPPRFNVIYIRALYLDILKNNVRTEKCPVENKRRKKI